MRRKKFNFKEDFKKLIPLQKENVKLNLSWQKFDLKKFKDACLKAEKNDDMFLFHEKNNLVGWLWLSYPNEKSGYITHVQIAPKYRGEGHGKKLMIFAFNYLKGKRKKEVLLKVTKANNAALTLYEKIGFKKISEDDRRILMKRILK